MAAAATDLITGGKKVRKAYTITKSRESWTDEEHDKFIQALQMFDRDWKRIEEFVSSKTVIQIRSHAQKYFLKVKKNGTTAHVPPPRSKRKAAHLYPQKALKNVLLPLEAAPLAYPTSHLTSVNSLWDDNDASILLNNESTTGIMLSQDEYANLYQLEDDIGSAGNGGSSNTEIPQQAPVQHGLPDFSEVYSFIGSVFDPDTKDHVQKLKEMHPINFETVLLLIRNLTINLSSPDFEPIDEIA